MFDWTLLGKAWEDEVWPRWMKATNVTKDELTIMAAYSI